MDKNCPLRHPGRDRKSNSSSSKFSLLYTLRQYDTLWGPPDCFVTRRERFSSVSLLALGVNAV